MKTLWTPWRMEHVTGIAKKIEGCLFAPPGEGRQEKEYLLLFRDNHDLVLLNRFPYANGHLLIAPRRRVAHLGELENNEVASLFDLVRLASRIIEEQLLPDGLNIGCNIGEAAGAGIADHLHVHVVPRWKNDHNFITVLSEVRTIPEHIEETYLKLAPHFMNIR